MNIPMTDLREQYHDIRQEIDAAVMQVLSDTRYILGPNVQAFEQEAADYLGVKHAVGVASGSDALLLSLRAIGIGPGDEVITTPFTFFATAETINLAGATPVFADIDPRTFNIDIDSVAQAITAKTRAVIPVHLFGQPADMIRLNELCESSGLAIIEDCAQSFGAHINGKMTGSFGNCGAFSFFPSKNLGCFGDGGLVATNDEDLAMKIRSLRNHGSQKPYQHDIIGYNSRLDELQAAILRVKLKYINNYNLHRRKVAETYTAALAGTDIQPPYEDGTGVHVFHQYTLLHNKRDVIIRALRDNEIACTTYYQIPLHKQNAYKDTHEHVSLPVSESVADRCLSLPIFPELDANAIATITDIIKGVV